MFKIGEFSKLSRVSVRMLRHYDRLGLLKPAQIDSLTNYRYYSAEQLPRLNRLIALKDLGFTLEQIAHLLADELSPDQLRGMLKLKRAELEQEVQDGQMRLARVEARLRQIESEATAVAYDVILREIAPLLVASIRQVVLDSNQTQLMFEDVEAYVARHHARADAPPLTIYHDPDYRETDLDTQVAVPIAFTIPESENVRVRELPRVAAMACVIHRGDYATSDAAYNALLMWIQANCYRIAGPTREVYLRFNADGLDLDLPKAYLTQDSNAYVTELQLPVEKG